jgi:hypothetical protein
MNRIYEIGEMVRQGYATHEDYIEVIHLVLALQPTKIEAAVGHFKTSIDAGDSMEIALVKTMDAAFPYKSL